MYIGVSQREERLILEALAKFLHTKNTRIKPSIVSNAGSKTTTTSLALQSLDGETVKENFEYFCKILGLRQEKLRFFESGIGKTAIFALTHNFVRVYAVQNLGKDSTVREFEKRVKLVYPMTSKIKDYLYESTIDCPSIERFLASSAVPCKILTKSDYFAEIKFNSITVSITDSNSKLLVQYSGV